MARDYSVIERPTDAAGSEIVTGPLDVISISAPVASDATVELDGGPRIPVAVWPGVRSLCGHFDRAVVRWGASAGGTIYIMHGSDLDLMMQAVA